MAKERVDVLAYKQGLFETREQAKRGVMAGLVVAVLNGERFDKPGEKIPDDTELKLKGEKLKYVSRGGLKLEKALDIFDLSVRDKRPLISELQLEVLRMSCCKMVLNKFLQLMLVLIN